MERPFFVSTIAIGILSAVLAIAAEGDKKEKETKESQPVEKHEQKEMRHTHKKTCEEEAGFDSKQKEGIEAVCPVTKERFKITKDSPYSIYKGRYYYFCCDGCKPSFDKNPDKYIQQ